LLVLRSTRKNTVQIHLLSPRAVTKRLLLRSWQCGMDPDATRLAETGISAQGHW